jgi:hypothetical protein
MLSSCQPETSETILCCYVNNTSQIQIGRIANVASHYLERVIFPGQRLLFEAPPQAELEIYTNSFSSALLSQKIRCESIALQSSVSGS